MNNGYMGKVLVVNLTTRDISEQELHAQDARKFIGGAGLGTKYLYDLTDDKTDPLGPENVMIFAVGPMTGTGFYNSDRFDVVTKSPLTGIFLEASCGGFWGSKFKRCGYDALIVKGKADSPVYLAITDETVEIKDASDLWGKDTFETTELLKEAEGKTSRAAVIGQAGENQVKIACIIGDGRHGRAVGRGGAGAVMGSKNLKAVVVNGKKPVEVANREALKGLTKGLLDSMKNDVEVLREGGTAVGLQVCESIGNLPIKNWKGGEFIEGAKEITGMKIAETDLISRYNCGSCLIKCGRVVEAKDGPYKGLDIAGPEYETLGTMGSNLMIDDRQTIYKENELCNRYGLDTISAGNVIGFGMECWEAGLINEEDTNGLKLEFGNKEAAIKMVEEIALKQNFGAILAEGVRRASEKIGGISKEFAIEVKGMEPPAHDPRSKQTVALGYVTSNRGACHLSSFSHDFEEGAVLEDMDLPAMTDRFDTTNKAEITARYQELMRMFDSLCMCKFAIFGGVTVNPLIEAINAVTGFDMNKEEFFKTGERIHTLQRMYNNKLGISRKDDRLPVRFETQLKNEKTTKLPPTNQLLSEYYEVRKWNEYGLPKEELIEELELTEFCS